MRVAVVGGGVVGLSVGLAAIERGAQVTIFEKDASAGSHASSRNSGVLHSGIYYHSDSLKASFSVQGNQEIRRLCRDNEINLIDKGKIILSRDQEAEDYLDVLESRAINNEVAYERYDKSHLVNFEPLAKTQSSFLWVKSTAVGSPKDIFEVLSRKFLESGGKLVTGKRISLQSDFEALFGRYGFEIVVNAAGSQAVRLARASGLRTKYLTAPFLGLYWGVPKSELSISMPIYPTPHQLNPFLGVHLTPTISGVIKIGPSAIPVFGLEQYEAFSGFRIGDSIESSRAMLRIALGKNHSFGSMIREEIPKFRRSKMIREASELHGGVKKEMPWRAIPGGIRAQLVDQKGKLVDDFVVEKQDKIVHILNAVSPGWTSALPFGRWVVKNYVLSNSERNTP